MKNILYLHIAKTGGTSITHALLQNNKYVYPEYLRKHMFMSQALKRCEYHNFKPDFVFSVVRNPYTRMQSAFQHLKNNYALSVVKDSNGKFIPVDRSAGEFKLFHNITFKDWLIYTLYTRYSYSSVMHSCHTQSAYIQQYNCAIYKIEEINKLEIDIGISVPKLNKVTIRHPCEYDDETRSLVSSYFIEDFNRFGYEI